MALQQQNEKHRIPITVITGFLGSGKTTLLNHILDYNSRLQESGKKRSIAVIENEFAAAFGIENEILHHDKAQDIQNLYEFGMGCVCCSSSGELINALVEIASRNQHYEDKKMPTKKIDHVILETTGLADPTPILELIKKGADQKGTDDIVQNYYLHGIVTLIDAKHFYQEFLKSSSRSNSSYKNELLAQILTTDTIILNKADAVIDKLEIEKIKSLLQLHNPTAELYITSYAKVPIEEAIFKSKRQTERRSSSSYYTPSETAVEEAKKKHDPSIEQTMLLAPGFVNLEAVKSFLKQVTRTYDIYRIKGVLALKEKPQIKFVLQGVGDHLITVTEHGEWNDQPHDTADEVEVKESRITLIGRDILKHSNALEKQLNDTCLIQEDCGR